MTNPRGLTMAAGGMVMEVRSEVSGEWGGGEGGGASLASHLQQVILCVWAGRRPPLSVPSCGTSA